MFGTFSIHFNAVKISAIKYFSCLTGYSNGHPYLVYLDHKIVVVRFSGLSQKEKRKEKPNENAVWCQNKI